jgi:hypothetical protein
METPTLNRFSAVEVRDMVIQAEGDVGVALESNQEVRLASVQIDHRSPRPCWRIAGAQRVSMTGCEITAVGPNTAAVVCENITGDCQVERNRFVGVVSFYGDPAEPTIPLLRGLFDRGLFDPRRPAPLDSVPAQLKFCSNSVSLLAAGEAVTRSLSGLPPIRPIAGGLFETATVAGNTIAEPLNLVVARFMIVVSSNILGAEPGADTVSVYGLFIAEPPPPSAILQCCPRLTTRC